MLSSVVTQRGKKVHNRIQEINVDFTRSKFQKWDIPGKEFGFDQLFLTSSSSVSVDEGVLKFMERPQLFFLILLLSSICFVAESDQVLLTVSCIHLRLTSDWQPRKNEEIWDANSSVKRNTILFVFRCQNFTQDLIIFPQVNWICDFD